MNILRLPAGKQAPRSIARIEVWREGRGMYDWNGALMSGSDAIFGTGIEHRSRAQAEADGIAWAQSYGVAMLAIQF